MALNENQQAPDTWQLGSTELNSRLMLAIPETAELDNLGAVLEAGAIESATIKVGTDLGAAAPDAFTILRDHGVHILPNTVDAADAAEAVRAAHHGAALVGRPWVKPSSPRTPSTTCPTRGNCCKQRRNWSGRASRSSRSSPTIPAWLWSWPGSAAPG
ncbi:hypothetical protein ACPCDX_15245 [Streptomyces koyangensis]|uniref:hypothetical protein n=1 Tax=Streptomyces koyangensis TaxID=188770 RepID=UPI003C2E3330